MIPAVIFVGIFILFGRVNAGGWSEGPWSEKPDPPAVPLNDTPQNNSTIEMSQIPLPNIDAQMFHIRPINMNDTAPNIIANNSTTDNADNQGQLSLKTAVIHFFTTFVHATPLSYFTSSPDNAEPYVLNSTQNSTAVISPVPTTTPAGPSTTEQSTPTSTASSPTFSTQLLAPDAMPAQPVSASANVNFGLFSSGVLGTVVLVLGTVFLW